MNGFARRCSGGGLDPPCQALQDRWGVTAALDKRIIHADAAETMNLVPILLPHRPRLRTPRAKVALE
jgi:hypothetical protein